VSLADDVRYAFRALRSEPAFTLAAISTLALSLAANTSVFTVVKSVLLAELDMRDPGRLVAVRAMRNDGGEYPWNIPNFLDLRDTSQVLDGAAAYGGWNANLTGDAEPVRLFGVRVTGNFFQMTGVRAVAGRTLEPADDTPGRNKVVVLTYGLWTRRFAGDPTVVGRSIQLNGEPYTVVGVLPRSFTFRNLTAEIASPLAPDADPTRAVRGGTAFLSVYARVKPGIPPSAVQTDLDGAVATLRQRYPVENARYTGVKIVPMREDITGSVRPMLTVLLGAVALVLLIACANISSLLVARASRRRRDLAVRAALGASPARIARQLIVEGILLSSAGGVLGVVLAHWGVALLLAVSPIDLPRAAEVGLDGGVLAIAAAVSLACGVLFSVLPAWQAGNPDLIETLRAGGRSAGANAATARFRGAIVIAEVALSLVLLSGAGLLLQSFARLTASDPGFRAENVVTARLALPITRYRTPANIANFHDRLYERLAALPQVTGAGAISILPLSGPLASADFTIAGDPPPSDKDKPSTNYRMIDGTYFAAMSIPLLRGRGFSEHDNENAPPVAIVSQALARRYWGDRNPVGTHILLNDRPSGARDVEVVGVSGLVREQTLDQPPTPCLFVPLAQVQPHLVRFAANNMFWAIRTRPGAALDAEVRRQIHQVDGDVAALLAPMQFYLDKSSGTQRFSLRILAAFALAALLLAASGLYALVSYSTAQRTREIGVRMALGARAPQVAGLIMRQGMSLVAIGVALGAAGSWAASGYLSTLLFEISAHDPATLAVAAMAMLAAGAAACYAPVRRALSADPMRALGSE
jgi:putative ABC transport system permease protein